MIWILLYKLLIFSFFSFQFLMEMIDTSTNLNLEETEIEEDDDEVMKANMEVNKEMIFDFAIKIYKKMKKLALMQIAYVEVVKNIKNAVVKQTLNQLTFPSYLVECQKMQRK